MMTNREKLAALASKRDTKLLEKAKWRKENRAWLRKSQAIALQILKALDDQNLTQKQLADKLDVSPQVVSKWVKGQENFTLETISKIEDALGLTISLALPTQQKQEQWQAHAVLRFEPVHTENVKFNLAVGRTILTKTMVVTHKGEYSKAKEQLAA